MVVNSKGAKQMLLGLALVAFRLLLVLAGFVFFLLDIASYVINAGHPVGTGVSLLVWLALIIGLVGWAWRGLASVATTECDRTVECPLSPHTSHRQWLTEFSGNLLPHRGGRGPTCCYRCLRRCAVRVVSELATWRQGFEG